MIVTKIYGGLAGQMFQYSLGRHLSLKNKTPLYLDTSWYNENNNSKYPRDFKLDKLNTKFRTVDSTSLLWRLRFYNRFKALNPIYYKKILEKDFRIFDDNVLLNKNRILIDGYWNSHKYFEDIRDILIRDFEPDEEADAKNKEVLQKINSLNSVSVHFRRGDYALTSFHGILTKEYYENAINKITDGLVNPYLFIFSDEPDWVRKNISFPFQSEVVDINGDHNNYWDIQLMKTCKHNIIANSGFSWWGAWLNENPDKRVIAPKKWINHTYSTFENIPSGWCTI